MAELEESVSESCLAEKDQQDTYSFTECQTIGKNFLNELKQSLRATNLPDIEEPRTKATKYLEETEVLQLLEVRKLIFTPVVELLITSFACIRTFYRTGHKITGRI